MAIGLYIGITVGSSFITQDTIEEYQGLAISATSGDNESTFEVSENSLSGKLVPHNQVEMVVFGFLRVFLYLMPDTSILTAFSNDPTLYRFGPFTQFVTGGLMALLIPLVFLSIWKIRNKEVSSLASLTSILLLSIWKTRKRKVFNLTSLSYILLLLSIWKTKKMKLEYLAPFSYVLIVLILFVSFSRPGMVHQRYRIVYDCLYFFYAILAIGYFPKRYIMRVMRNWLFLIVPTALILVLYKLMS